MPPLLILLLLSLSCHVPSAVVHAHESCCKAKLLQQSTGMIPRFIDDPNEIPPDFDSHGEPRLIENGCDVMPDDWDEEDDGEWAPGMMENPDYQWTPRQIPNPDYAEPPGFTKKLSTEISAALPWVTLGILITGVLSSVTASVFPQLEASMTDLLNVTSGSSGILPLVWASIAGLTVPLCSCGALPLCAGLLKKQDNKQGLSLAMVMAFLTASQSAGLDSAAITYGLLGPAAMLGRLVGAILLAVAVGMACPTNKTQQQSTTDEKAASNGKTMDNVKTSTCHAPASAPTSILSHWCETALEIYPTVLMGLLLSTAALHYLPSLTNYKPDVTATTNDATIRTLLTRLSVLASAIPLQLCEHTSVTLASAIQKADGSPGLAFAFLLSAPAMNMPSLLFVLQSGGVMAVVRVVLALTTTALVLSFSVDAYQWDFLAGETTGEMAELPSWFVGTTSECFAGLLLFGGLVQKYQSSLRSNNSKNSSNGDCCSSNGKAKVD